MLSESARMTSAHEAQFRIQHRNSRDRAVKVVALDARAAAIIDELAKLTWHGAAFFTSLSFAASGAPGDASGQSLQGWLKDLAGRTMDLVSEVAACDFVVVVTSAGADARAVSIVADACALHHKSLVGLVVPQPGAADADITASLGHLRPYTRMLVVANDASYVEAMLTALRA